MKMIPVVVLKGHGADQRPYTIMLYNTYTIW